MAFFLRKRLVNNDVSETFCDVDLLDFFRIKRLTFLYSPPIIRTYELIYFSQTRYAPRESGIRPLAYLCRECDKRCEFDRSKVITSLLSATADSCGGFVLLFQNFSKYKLTA